MTQGATTTPRVIGRRLMAQMTCLGRQNGWNTLGSKFRTLTAFYATSMSISDLRARVAASIFRYRRLSEESMLILWRMRMSYLKV